jgi:squalene-hopene/tetraprenyl-beta-curcumene cyclase
MNRLHRAGGLLTMKLAIITIVGLLLFGIGTHRAASRDDGAASSSWDREGAARYLDERMQVWFANGKKLRTGQAETVCVSCHTSLPYALARPALRRAMKVSAFTAQEMRLLEETTRRVESYGDHQPLYDHSESKKTESRGTEAVLNALILASADDAQSRRDPSATTQQALKRLWQTQRPDGAWDWLDFGLEPFETVDGVYYGATLAALAIGRAPGSATTRNSETIAGVEKLRAYLKEKYAAQRLFNRIWLLLASTRLNDLLTTAQRVALITEIQGRQHDDGGWALESLGTWRWSKTSAPFRAPGTTDEALLAKSDGYATGLIVYTLRQAGLPVAQPAVSKGLQWLRANQQDMQVSQHSWPAWRAHSLNFDREHGGEKGEPWRRMFMSDSATAFAVLALVDSD